MFWKNLKLHISCFNFGRVLVGFRDCYPLRSSGQSSNSSHHFLFCTSNQDTIASIPTTLEEFYFTVTVHTELLADRIGEFK